MKGTENDDNEESAYRTLEQSVRYQDLTATKH